MIGDFCKPPSEARFMGSESTDQDQPMTEQAGEPSSQTRSCPACGAEATRAKARFCSTCGRALEDSYLPADGLRSSYHLQHKPSRSRKPKGAKPKIKSLANNRPVLCHKLVVSHEPVQCLIDATCTPLVFTV